MENGSGKPAQSTSQITLVHPNGIGDRRWSVFEKVLLALALIFFVGFVVFVALYASELSSDEDKNGTTTKAKGKNQLPSCSITFSHVCDNKLEE